MKKIGLICVTTIACLSLAACGNQSSTKKANSSSKTSSSKVVKHHKKQNKKKQSSSSSASSKNQSSKQQNKEQNNNSTQQTAQSNNSQSSSQGVNNADEALAAARAKYGDGNGNYHWTVMYDAGTGQPIRNADGSYFVKAIDPTQGTMTGTAQSVNVYPDGSMTSN